MGIMKTFLMEKITEFVALHPQWTEEEIYRNDTLYAMALEYADKCLKGIVK